MTGQNGRSTGSDSLGLNYLSNSYWLHHERLLPRRPDGTGQDLSSFMAELGRWLIDNDYDDRFGE